MVLQDVYGKPSSALKLLLRLHADEDADAELSAQQQRTQQTHDDNMLDYQVSKARSHLAAADKAERERERSCCDYIKRMMASQRRKTRKQL